MSAIADYLRAQRAALLSAEPAVRAGDADAVHDMRVAVRRLRATLRTFRPMLDTARTEPLRAELGWFGDLLGPVRDGDVLASRLALMIDREPPDLVVGPVAARINQRLSATSVQARADLASGMDSPRYVHMMSRLAGVIDDSVRPAGARQVRRRARRAVQRAQRMLDEAAQAVSTCDSRAEPLLHGARRAYKRARYAVEVVAPRGSRQAARLVRRLKAVQDLLGEFQDAVVAESLLREYGMIANLDLENAFTYGLLHARQRPAGRWSVPGLARTRRRASRSRLRRWLG